ncbi:MBOAT family protein [candidate division KSB1 bacterium]|nr:MBOAT family protein [candidate division KSB1 bacterium]
MLFNSIDFCIFFPLVVFLFYLIPHKYRWVLLLVASYVFYAWWNVKYLILIITSTLIDYIAGRNMGDLETGRRRKLWLVLSLCTNLGLLFSFKYFNFFSSSISGLMHYFDFHSEPLYLNVLLPVGISFYTFQTLAYTIDVYRGQQHPEKHLGIFAVYVAYFPQLVAGPIERSQNLLPQIRAQHHFDYDRAASGVRLMLWGFFKKVVIADRLAVYVDMVYSNPSAFSGLPLIMATYFFAFQIYCDFSGYSDIAIGSARIMGVDLMINFRRPYFAKSIHEFWKRWHISLSTWFRDYFYISIGGNRVKKSRWFFNLFITFLVSGLWHGANWTFIVWGALHGFYLIFSIITRKWRDRVWDVLDRVRNKLSTHGKCRILDLLASFNLRNIVAVFITFHLVLISWVFFRANSLADAFVVFQRALFIDVNQLGINIALGKRGMAIALFTILLMETVHFYQRKLSVQTVFRSFPSWLRWCAYLTIVVLILILGEFGANEFIYFQF